MEEEQISQLEFTSSISQDKNTSKPINQVNQCIYIDDFILQQNEFSQFANSELTQYFSKFNDNMIRFDDDFDHCTQNQKSSSDLNQIDFHNLQDIGKQSVQFHDFQQNAQNDFSNSLGLEFPKTLMTLKNQDLSRDHNRHENKSLNSSEHFHTQSQYPLNNHLKEMIKSYEKKHYRSHKQKSQSSKNCMPQQIIQNSKEYLQDDLSRTQSIHQHNTVMISNQPQKAFQMLEHKNCKSQQQVNLTQLFDNQMNQLDSLNSLITNPRIFGLSELMLNEEQSMIQPSVIPQLLESQLIQRQLSINTDSSGSGSQQKSLNQSSKEGSNESPKPKRIKIDAIWKPILRKFRQYFQNRLKRSQLGIGYNYWREDRMLMKIKEYMKSLSLSQSQVNSTSYQAAMMHLIFSAKGCKNQQKFSFTGRLGHDLELQQQKYIKVFIKNNRNLIVEFFSDTFVLKLWKIYLKDSTDHQNHIADLRQQKQEQYQAFHQELDYLMADSQNSLNLNFLK